MNIKLLSIIAASCFSPLCGEKNDFKKLLSDALSISTPDGKIVLSKTIRRVRLDIGLSYSAPISQQWLSSVDDLIVFGFEPNPEAVASILRGAVKQDPRHGEPLDTRYIDSRFFLIPCALGNSERSTIPFYVTAGDCGCSSIYKPTTIPVKEIIEVPIFPLRDFFEQFPFDTHPIIEYIKIDAQGADLDIVKSGGDYIARHVLFITLEAENSAYIGTHNSTRAIDSYMKSIGFIRYYGGNTQDPTFMNARYQNYIAQNPVQIYQQ